MKQAFERITSLVRKELGLGEALPLNETEINVWKLARNHKVGAILAPHILETNEPKGLVDEARYVWQLGALREQYYIQKCDELVELLRTEGIKAVPLKGVELAKKAYPKKGFRAFRDIDVLVSIDQVEKVDEILKANQYQEIFPNSPLRRAAKMKGGTLEAVKAGIEGLSYQKDDLYLEIHTRIVPYLLGEYSLGHVWDGGEFSAEDFMCHLLIHTSRHHFLYGLRHLVDIALWAGKVRSMEIVETKLSENDLLWLAYPSWKLASEYFPDSIDPPPSATHLKVLKYTKQIRKHFFEIPFLAIPLSGSPIPFLQMKGGILKTVQSNEAMMNYQLGNSSRFKKWFWKITRPIGLAWRHAPVIWTLLKLRLI